MATRSEEITTIIKSAIDEFDAGIETRSVGTVVEVGDGIAQVYGLEAALASELLEFPGGVMGMALNLEEETVGAVHPGRLQADQGRRPGQDHRPRRRGAGRRGADRPRRRLAGQPDRRQGPDQRHRAPPGGAHRPRRHQAQERRHAGPDRHQGHRRADPDRPRPARADHRRPPDRQVGHRHRHDHQPEGQGPGLHLRGHRPEALDRRQDRRGPRAVRRDGAHHRRRRRRRGPGARPVPRPLRRCGDGRGDHGERRRAGRQARQGRAVRLRRPDQARLGVPRDVAAAAPPARPRGVSRRRLLPALAACSSAPRA